MSRTPLLLTLALATLSTTGCSGDRELELMPSLSQLRYGKVEVPAEQMPVLPEIHHLLGVVTNTEEEPGYNDGPPLLLTDDQLESIVNLDDPVALERHATNDYTRVMGDLYDDEEGAITYTDVRQGAIGDCYLAAALSAVLYADNDGRLREGLIRPVLDRDGNPSVYAVRFYDAWGTPQDIEVDPDLVRSSSGNATYMRSADSSRGSEEFAISLIEKAYASWHGSYEEIGNGGNSGDAMQAFTGSNSTWRTLKYLSDDSLLKSVATAAADNRPMTASTFGKDDGVDYEGTGVYAWHAYTLMGARKTDEDVVRVQLRNPWGSSEPAGNGEDDGIFELDVDTFRTLYKGITLGGGYSADTVAPAAVNDLTVRETYDGGIVLGFSAVGDDREAGLATTYDVRVSAQPITEANFYEARRVDVASPQAPGTAEGIEINELEAGSTWFAALRVEDESGNISPLSNVVEATAGAPVDVVVTEPIVSYDFESGAGDWDAFGLFHITNSWAASGTHSFWMGQASTGDYNTGARVSADLTSPLIDLTGASAPQLLWTQLLEVEPGLSSDLATVEVAGSADGFDAWTKVWSRGDVSHTPGMREHITVDLTAFAGQQVYLFYVFDSVDALDNDFGGWHIDDVQVVEAQ